MIRLLRTSNNTLAKQCGDNRHTNMIIRVDCDHRCCRCLLLVDNFHSKSSRSRRKLAWVDSLYNKTYHTYHNGMTYRIWNTMVHRMSNNVFRRHNYGKMVLRNIHNRTNPYNHHRTPYCTSSTTNDPCNPDKTVSRTQRRCMLLC